MTGNADALTTALLQSAHAAHARGSLAEAREIYLRILSRAPDHAPALHGLGVATCQSGDRVNGARLLERALVCGLRTPNAYFNWSSALLAIDRPEEALNQLDEAVRLRPDYVEAWLSRGLVLAKLQRHPEAVAALERVLQLQPDHGVALMACGNSLAVLGRHSRALANFDHLTAREPRNVEAHFNRGNALVALGRHAEATAAYDQALSLRADYAAALCNRAHSLAAQLRLEEALASLDRALAIDARLENAWLNRGNVLQTLGRNEEALQAYQAAIAVSADARRGLSNRSHLLNRLGRWAEALAGFDDLLNRDPIFTDAAGARLLAARSCCNWANADRDIASIEQQISSGHRVAPPLAAIATLDSPSLQLACARRWIGDESPARPDPAPRREHKRDGPLRVAYVSADLCDHPVGQAIVAVLERHDRRRCEVHAVALARSGPEDELARRIRIACDAYLDGTTLTDEQIARRLREMRIDVVVDLTGLTSGCRPGVFAYRPAPVHVGYLGYPGTSGAPYLDYLLADATVIPAAETPAYSEQVVFLPGAFFPVDGLRPMSHTPSRSQLQLPEEGFLFCCFNAPFKITPQVFDSWLALLADVRGSLLWLRRGDPTAANNLLARAQAYGIAPERLVFAPRIAEAADYLASYRIADLFLDTFPYGAHSTAADALYAGLPVLTRAGRSFASRVCASMLHTMGVPELVTQTPEEYRARALELAHNPERLCSLRERLAESRRTSRLFDTGRLCRSLESAYETMLERALSGAAPESFTLPDRPEREGCGATG